MTVFLRSTAIATNDGAYDNPVTVSKPAGTVSGDVLVAVVFQSYEAGGNSVTLPSGFTVTGTSGVVTGAAGIWAQTAYKVAGNSEPASYTFTGAGNPSAEIILFAVGGANTSTPIGGAATYTAGSVASTSHTTPTVTPVAPTDLLLTAVSCVASSLQYTGYPAGMRAGTDFLDPTNYEEATWATAPVSSTTATGTRTFTHNNAAQWVGVALTIQSATVGTPILRSTPGVTASVAVEVAWGSAPTSDPTLWTWTDITGDVQMADTIKMVVGKQSSESVTPPPASLNITLDNRLGSYSRGPQSSNYPNVVKGVPIRCRVITPTVSSVRFQGEVASWTPDWDSTGGWATVQVTANGSKRRLQVPQPAGYSLLRQFLTYLASTNQSMSYWPCEESTGTRLYPSRAGIQRIQIAGGTPNLASYSGFAGSGQIPTLSTGESWWGAPTIAGGASGAVAFSLAFLLATPAAGFPDQTTIVQLNTAGSTAQLQLRYAGTPTVGGLRLLGLDFKGNTTLDSGTILPANTGYSVVGQPCVVVIAMSNNVLTFEVFSFTESNSGSAGYVYSLANGTLTAIDSFVFSPAGVMQGASIGHISCQQARFESGSGYYPYAYGFEFDLTTGGVHVPPWVRMEAAANIVGERVPVQVNGAGNNQNTSTPAIGVARMGAYPVGQSFLQIAEEASLADGGMLADGVDGGGGNSLVFYTRDSAENVDATLTLVASSSQMEHPVSPVDDDVDTINSVTVTRQGGSTITVSDTTDSMATTRIGVRNNSQTVNIETDAQAQDWAGWRLHLGTVDDYRWPTVNLWLHHKPTLLAAWLAMTLWSRIDVTNLSTVRPQLPAGTLSLLALGWSETINQFEWPVQANCASYDPWQVAVLAQNTGDTGEFLARLDTDGSTTYTTANVGDTALHVQVNTGPLWTTNSDDFPLYVNAGGWKIRVTNIFAAVGIDQTFAVDALTAPIPSGSPVTVWKPPVLAR